MNVSRWMGYFMIRPSSTRFGWLKEKLHKVWKGGCIIIVSSYVVVFYSLVIYYCRFLLGLVKIGEIQVISLDP